MLLGVLTGFSLVAALAVFHTTQTAAVRLLRTRTAHQAGQLTAYSETMYPPALSMLYCLILALSLFSPLSLGQDTAPIVDLGYAKYQGTFASNISASDLGSPLQQAMAIMNDTIFVCPTYYLLEAFHGHAFKGQYAVFPAAHGQEVFYYFPSLRTPYFTNTDFVKAFSEFFTAFISSQDPNDTFEPTITPAWDPYVFTGSRAEMLFNKTEDGEPVVQEYTTSTSLLERCAFWHTVGDETGQ